MFKNRSVALVSWLLIFQISAGPVFARGQSRSARDNDLTEVHLALGESMLDPRIAAIENDPSVDAWNIDLSIQDAVVDADPFFLRSQGWSDAAEPNREEGPVARASAQGIEIQPRALKKIWRLNAPLHAVGTTDEYVFLAASDDRYFATRGGGQGLFLVPYQRLLSASASSAPVPVFFLPLPGAGWVATAKSDVQVSEVPHRDVLVLADNQGVELPIKSDDIRTVARVEGVNLMLAQAQAMQGNPDRSKALSELITAATTHRSDLLAKADSILASLEALAPRGSTAGFGMLYTGFDLDHPESGSVLFETAQSKRSSGILHALMDAVGIRSAHAMDPKVVKFLTKTARVLAICGIALIASVVLRNTALKARIDARVAEARAKGDLKAARRAKWDIWAHMMTTLSQFPTVWSAQTLRFVLDKAAVSEHGITRKIFNSTFGFCLRTSDKTPVNAKTALYGVGVLGGVDTALVAVQGYFLLEWLADGMAWAFPQLAPRVDAAYHSGNAAVSLYLMLSVVQNGVAWLTSGSYNFAHDVQTIKLNEAERAVAEKMRAEGKDPDSGLFKKEYDKRVKEYVRVEMDRQGLPQESDFLFDANTLWSKARAFFGYEPPVDEATYKGAERPGLMGRALRQAITIAENELKLDRASREKQEALELLKESRARFSLLRSFWSAPGAYFTAEGLRQVAQAYRQTRRELVALTFEGDANDAIMELPPAWVEKRPDGARLAAQTFRSAFFMIQDDPLRPASKARGKIADAVKAPFRFLDRVFESWQIGRAITRAKEAYLSRTGQDPEDVMAEDLPEPSAGKRLWDELFQKELVRAAGIFLDYGRDNELVNAVEEKAAAKLKGRLETDKDFQAQLAKLDPVLRNRRLVLQKADYFNEAYVEETIQKDGADPVATWQPGVFQRIRRWEGVRRSGMATKLLRGIEGMMSNTRYKRGLSAQLMRSVPLLEDVIQGNTISVRGFLVSATVGYWWMSSFWGSAFPRDVWFFNVVLAGTLVRAPWMTTLRATSNMGIKPNSKIRSMVDYGIIGSFATMFGLLVQPLYQADFIKALDSVGSACSRLLLGH